MLIAAKCPRTLGAWRQRSGTRTCGDLTGLRWSGRRTGRRASSAPRSAGLVAKPTRPGLVGGADSRTEAAAAKNRVDRPAECRRSRCAHRFQSRSRRQDRVVTLASVLPPAFGGALQLMLAPACECEAGADHEFPDGWRVEEPARIDPQCLRQRRRGSLRAVSLDHAWGVGRWLPTATRSRDSWSAPEGESVHSGDAPNASVSAVRTRPNSSSSRVEMLDVLPSSFLEAAASISAHRATIVVAPRFALLPFRL